MTTKCDSTLVTVQQYESEARRYDGGIKTVRLWSTTVRWLRYNRHQKVKAYMSITWNYNIHQIFTVVTNACLQLTEIIII